MNHSQMVALADAIRGVRPDWQQPGIIAQLKVLAENWKGTDGAFSLHAMAVAANPAAVTPGALNATLPTHATPAPRPSWNEPTCHTCSQSRSRCLSRRDWEIRHGLEPHDFETREDAELHATKAGHK